MKTINVVKGQVLQTKGELDTKVYVVQSGLLRSYSIDENGKEHIYLFAPEEWIIADACRRDEPCELFIDAIEDATVTVHEKVLGTKIVDQQPFINRLRVLQNRIILLMSASAIERYEHFVETYPDIVQRVPQRMIASYLGMTPEALSKVKSARVKGKVAKE
ncbi:MAG: Crp/Fnr family transcriptional regulator [Bacteroidota bacterium]